MEGAYKLGKCRGCVKNMYYKIETTTPMCHECSNIIANYLDNSPEIWFQNLCYQCGKFSFAREMMTSGEVCKECSPARCTGCGEEARIQKFYKNFRCLNCVGIRCPKCCSVRMRKKSIIYAEDGTKVAMLKCLEARCDGFQELRNEWN